jgi:hypothetical protein
MPKDGKIQELGRASNAEAKAGGMSSPVFCEDQAFWQKNEANPDLQTEPGKTYRFRIPQGSRDRSPDQAEFLFHAPLAPLGAIALAEACERLQTNNEGSLYKIDDRSVWVMGATPGVALLSSVNGVFVSDNHVFSDLSVACAVLVPAPNQTS